MKAPNLKANLEAVADMIAARVTEMHEGLFEGMRWNPACGQWLVYGFERYLGFSGAAYLEAAVEQAYRAKKDVKAAALSALRGAA